jgi:chromosomal replication initiation ATPase DnaA
MTAIVMLDELNKRLPELCEHCRELVEDLPVKHEVETRVSQIGELLRQTCNEFGVAVADVQAKNNVACVVRVRRHFSRRAHNNGFSYPEIGRAICKHHSTIMHLVGKNGWEIHPKSPRSTR